MRLRFDNGPACGEGGGAAQFAEPVRMIRAACAQEVPDALAALDEARAEGYWVAGYASYELGYALEPRLSTRMPERRLSAVDAVRGVSRAGGGRGSALGGRCRLWRGGATLGRGALCAGL